MSFKINESGITYIKKVKLSNGFTGSSKFEYKDNILTLKSKSTKRIVADFDYKANSILQLSFDELLKECTKSNEINRTRPSFLQEHLDSLVVDNKDFWSNYLHKDRRKFGVNKTKLRNKIIAFSKLKESRKHLYFWTITFPLNTSDELCMKYFNIWLTRCRKSLGLMSYIWVCERQQNGTLHFHLLVNVRMDVKLANHFMRATLKTAYNQDVNIFLGYNPEKFNGVDIDKNRKTKQVINFAKGNAIHVLRKYLTKYVTKNNEKYNHAPCHMSRDISALFTHKTIELIENEFIQNLLDRKISHSIYRDYYEFHSFEVFLDEEQLSDLYELNELIFNTIT